MGKLKFGELELSILRIVRELGRVTVRDVYKSLGSEGGYTTIMTVMSRMADKGDLKREKMGKHYVYWSNSQNTSSSQNVLKRIQDKIFGGRRASMVSYLLEMDQDISDQELEELEKLIQKKRSESDTHG
jgi:predicted transcriptional regulator